MSAETELKTKSSRWTTRIIHAIKLVAVAAGDNIGTVEHVIDVGAEHVHTALAVYRAVIVDRTTRGRRGRRGGHGESNRCLSL